jgi:hypothetical protein
MRDLLPTTNRIMPTAGLVIAFGAIACFAADAVSITITGSNTIELENSVIKAKYQPNSHDGGMVNFIIKEFNDDVAGGGGGERLDAGHERGAPKKATIIKDEPDEKTVEIEWTNYGKSQVTIFKDSPVLRIHYLSMWHIFEWGDNRNTNNGRFEIYGAAEFQELRGLSKMYPQYKESGGDPYFQVSKQGVDCPLNYQGHVILGMYHKDTQRGFVRVMPIDKLDKLKMMTGCGFEMYRNKTPLTGYLCAITGGAEQVIAYGKLLAEGKLGDISGQPVSAKSQILKPYQSTSASLQILTAYSLNGKRIHLLPHGGLANIPIIAGGYNKHFHYRVLEHPTNERK